jgi:hypothetical protein
MWRGGIATLRGHLYRPAGNRTITNSKGLKLGYATPEITRGLVRDFRVETSPERRNRRFGTNLIMFARSRSSPDQFTHRSGEEEPLRRSFHDCADKT